MKLIYSTAALAQRISAELLNKLEHLKQFPLLGTEVRQAPDPKTIRDLVVDRYVVRYLVAEKSIFILRVWHHREDRPGH